MVETKYSDNNIKEILNDVIEEINLMINKIQYFLSKDNKVENHTINNILEFIINLPKNYAFVLKQLEQTSIRFCDYYNPNICHTSEITKYFEDNYFEDDKENMTIVFAMYVFLKNANDIVEGLKFTDDMEELYDLLDNN